MRDCVARLGLLERALAEVKRASAARNSPRPVGSRVGMPKNANPPATTRKTETPMMIAGAASTPFIAGARPTAAIIVAV